MKRNNNYPQKAFSLGPKESSEEAEDVSSEDITCYRNSEEGQMSSGQGGLPALLQSWCFN